MDVAECFSEEVPTTHIDLRRRLSTGGRHYEISAAGTDDDRIALLIVGRDGEGAVLTEVAGEVPPEDLPAVTDLLTTTLAGLVSLSRDPAELRMSAVARKRKRHPNAGARWTADDQVRLVQRHHEGASVEELMRELGRNRGGILSRLVQLGELTQEHWPPSLGDTDEGGAGEGEAAEGGAGEGEADQPWAGDGGAGEGEAGHRWAGEGEVGQRWAGEGEVGEPWADGPATGERGLGAPRQRERGTRERGAGEGEAGKGGGREGEAGQRWAGEGEAGESLAGEAATGGRGPRLRGTRKRGTRERGAGEGSAGEGGVGGSDADDGALDEGAASHAA
jgi:hypothetical protein